MAQTRLEDIVAIFDRRDQERREKEELECFLAKNLPASIEEFGAALQKAVAIIQERGAQLTLTQEADGKGVLEAGQDRRTYKYQYCFDTDLKSRGMQLSISTPQRSEGKRYCVRALRQEGKPLIAWYRGAIPEGEPLSGEELAYAILKDFLEVQGIK